MKQLTREEYNQAKLFEVEKRLGSLAPTKPDCVNFSICCEMGTLISCGKCKRKRIRKW